MAVDIRDIFMVIRAKDQASRVLNQVGLNTTAAFRQVATTARQHAAEAALQSRRITQSYNEQILRQQKILNGALMQGNAQRAAAARQQIRDLRIMAREQQLLVNRERIAANEAIVAAKQQALARQEALETQRQAVRTGGAILAVGAGMALAGAVGVRAMHSLALGAEEYQRQAALTLTQVGNQKTSIQELQGISDRVARSVGVPLIQMQDALYDIFSSTNVQVKDSEKVLTAFARAAVAGQVDIQDASNATISIMNAYGSAAGNLNRILDVQFEAVRLGRMRYGEFAAAIGKAIPSAVNAGQAIETLAGSMAFLTRAGLTTAQAAVSFARLADLFTRPDVPFGLRQIGVELFDVTGKMRPLNQVLTEMAPHFLKLDQTARAKLFEKIFGGQGTIQARRFFNLAINNTKDLNHFIGEVTKGTGAFMDAYNIMAATTAVRTQVLKNNWQVFRNALGEEVIPSVNKLLEVGIDVLDWLNRLSPTQKRVLIDFLSWSSVIIGVSGVLVALAGTIKIVIAALGVLRLAAGAQGAAGALTLLGAAVGTTAVAMGGIIAVAAAAGLGIFYLTKHINDGTRASNMHEVGVARLEAVYRRTGRTAGVNASAINKVTTATKGGSESLSVMIKRQMQEVDAATVAIQTEKEMTKQLADLRAEYRRQADSIRDVILAHEGLVTQSKVTAGQVIRDIRNQVSNFKTYSKDVKRLIKEGVNPAAIEELSKKGPQYVHALATGSNRELQTYKRYWRDRQAEIKGSFEASMQKQFENLQKKIRAMQKEINKLKGKTVPVGATAHISLEQRTKQALNALGIKGYGVKFMAAGGITRLGDVAIVGEKGPELVQFNQPARVHNSADSKRMLDRGMANGGIIGGFRDPAVSAIERLGQLVVNGIAKVVGSSLSTAVNSALSGVGGVSVPSSRNRSIVHQIFSSMFGWLGSQLAAADQLIMRESGYRNTAQNPTSTAYGMFQFLNSTWAGTGIGKTSDPTLQAIAGGRYIRSRYGSPIGAWNFWQAHHWYHRGGQIRENILGVGQSGRTYGFQAGETVVPRGGGGLMLNFYAPVYGGRAGADQFASEVLDALERKGRRFGNPDVAPRVVGFGRSR